MAKNLSQNLLVVLESLPEIKYGCRPVGAHAEVFRFQLGIVINSAPVMDRLEDRQCLCDLLRSHPKLLPSMLSLERRTNSKAVQNKLLRSLGVRRTSGAAFEEMLYHPLVVIYQPMLRLLHHIITYQVYVDLRDRALLYLKLLTHAGSASLGVLMRGDSMDVDRETQKLARVLPKTIRLVNGPVPLSHYLQVVGRAKKGRALWIISVRSSSSQLEERSFPHAAVCVVETQVIGSASGETRAKITSSLSSGSKSPFQTTAIRTFQLSQRVLKSTWATCNRRQPV